MVLLCSFQGQPTRFITLPPLLILPKRLLQEPIVSCALGKLYNKDAILEYLLDKSSYGDGEVICGHIRSLKVSRYTISSFYIASFTFKPLDG